MCVLSLSVVRPKDFLRQTDSLEVQEKVNLDKRCYLCLFGLLREEEVEKKCFIWLSGSRTRATLDSVWL